MAYDKDGFRGQGGRKSYGEKSYGDKKPYDKKRYNDREGGYEKKSYGDKPYGERGGYRKGFESEGGEGYRKSYGERGGYKKDFSKDFGDKPYNKKPYGDKSYGEKKFDKKFDSKFDKKFDKKFEKKSDRDDERRNTAPVQEEHPQQQGGEDELPYLLIGRNAVREAVKNGRSIDRILVVKDQDGSLGEIVSMARDRNLVLRETDRRKLDEICMPFGHGGKTANHQGIVAYAAGVEYCQVSDILKDAKDRGEDPFVIVLDGIEDPYNLGSIIRSAECAGAHGVVIGKRRSASVTAAAVKSSAGATEYMKIARVVNISGAIEELKRAGLWVAGADMSGVSMQKQGLNGPLALVIGSEGSGMTKLVRESCDFLVSIPMFGHIDSLNAGVAAAVLMFEKRRQDAAEAEVETEA